jgi:hypothetical protein
MLTGHRWAWLKSPRKIGSRLRLSLCRPGLPSSKKRKKFTFVNYELALHLNFFCNPYLALFMKIHFFWGQLRGDASRLNRFDTTATRDSSFTEQTRAEWSTMADVASFTSWLLLNFACPKQIIRETVCGGRDQSKPKSNFRGGQLDNVGQQIRQIL